MWGALAGLAGSAISAGVNYKIAMRQMDFQERMSNTAYQRQMEDMRKAGLNPLFAGKMGGSTTPPGSAIPMGDLGATLGSAGQKFQQAATARQQQRLLKAQTDKSKSENFLLQQQFPEAITKGNIWRIPEKATSAGRKYIEGGQNPVERTWPGMYKKFFPDTKPKKHKRKDLGKGTDIFGDYDYR